MKATTYKINRAVLGMRLIGLQSQRSALYNQAISANVDFYNFGRYLGGLGIPSISAKGWDERVSRGSVLASLFMAKKMGANLPKGAVGTARMFLMWCSLNERVEDLRRIMDSQESSYKVTCSRFGEVYNGTIKSVDALEVLSGRKVRAIDLSWIIYNSLIKFYKLKDTEEGIFTGYGRDEEVKTLKYLIDNRVFWKKELRRKIRDGIQGGNNLSLFTQYANKVSAYLGEWIKKYEKEGSEIACVNGWTAYSLGEKITKENTKTRLYLGQGYTVAVDRMNKADEVDKIPWYDKQVTLGIRNEEYTVATVSMRGDDSRVHNKTRRNIEWFYPTTRVATFVSRELSKPVAEDFCRYLDNNRLTIDEAQEVARRMGINQAFYRLDIGERLVTSVKKASGRLYRYCGTNINGIKHFGEAHNLDEEAKLLSLAFTGIQGLSGYSEVDNKVGTEYSALVVNVEYADCCKVAPLRQVKDCRVTEDWTEVVQSRMQGKNNPFKEKSLEWELWEALANYSKNSPTYINIHGHLTTVNFEDSVLKVWVKVLDKPINVIDKG